MVSGHPKSRPHLTDASAGSASSTSAASLSSKGPMHPSLARVLLLVGVATFILALPGVNARATYGAQVTADEPQYLLTALSLGRDLNLDISDELAERRFLDFHEIQIDQQTVELGASGQRLSPHDPGLPILLAAPMRLGGWQGAKVGLAVIAAMTAAMTTWVSVRRFGVGLRTAAAVNIAMFATPPLTGYATQIYPEMPAALATMVAIAALVPDRTDGSSPKNTNDMSTPDGGRIPDHEAALGMGSQMAVVAAVIVLPWLAVKYTPVAAVLAVALLIKLGGPRQNVKRSAVTVAPAFVLLSVAGLLYLLIHQRIYGGWTVYAAGDHFVGDEFLVVGNQPDYLGRSQRFLGLLVDRGFGLIAWAPAFVLTVPALAAMAKRKEPGLVLLGSVLAAGWAVATWVALTMHGWWWPGRQVVVVLPVVVVALATFVDRRPALFRILMGLSVLAAINWFWLVVEASTGRKTLIVDFTETTSPLYRTWSLLLPDHRSPETLDVVLTVLWAVALLWFSVLAWRDGGQVATQRADDGLRG